MASAYPVAAIMLLALAGLILFPIAWLALAYWQRKNNLIKTSLFSFALSITPILSFIILYNGKEISAKYSVIIFFTTPIINIGLLLIMLTITIFKVKRNKLITSSSSVTNNP